MVKALHNSLVYYYEIMHAEENFYELQQCDKTFMLWGPLKSNTTQISGEYTWQEIIVIKSVLINQGQRNILQSLSEIFHPYLHWDRFLYISNLENHKSVGGGTCFLSQHLGARGTQISEFKAGLVCRVSSRTARATQWNPVSMINNQHMMNWSIINQQSI